jgi:hypothetical protein
MSLYDRIVLCEAATARAVYKGKKYQVLGYKDGGKRVELAWFSDATKSFTVWADHSQLEIDDPNKPKTKTPTKPPQLVKPAPAMKPATPARKPKASETVTTGVYKGKKYQVLGFKSGGKKVELAWFSDKTKSFVVPIQMVTFEGSALPKEAQAVLDQPSYYRFSTTLVKKGGAYFALKDRGVDVTKVVGPDGKNIGGAKRTNRTGGWRDRILQKFSELSGVHAQTFGDKKDQHKKNPTMADWEAIRARIAQRPKVKEAYFKRPKGWSQYALIVKVAK